MSTTLRTLAVGFVVALAAFAQRADAGDYASKANGDWSTPSTWNPAGNPTSGDNVTIHLGNIVDLDVAASGLINHASLWDAGSTLKLSRDLTASGTMSLYSGAKLDMNAKRLEAAKL